MSKDSEVSFGSLIFKNLIMGGTAGIIGASCVYPLDLVKTKMQFQKTSANPMYKGTIDCLKKTATRDGIRGLYRGLPAQLVGIAPEKAIKLTVNDTLRHKFTDKKTGKISVFSEVLSGCSAGLSQCIVTGPYELVKVRLQTQAGAVRKGAVGIIKELGVRGMFTGTGATLLRDIPFSGVYFTLYGNFNRMFADENGHLSFISYLSSGLLSGMIASYFATPADVIKTRLQAKSTEGVKYTGIIDCFTKTLKGEGPTAFFKGAVPRMLIISPLFGITLCVYEVLKGFFLPPELTKVN
eukprot:TRINITY_DN4679_c0_g1_i1.p1 TRINITY_DN4679_c0_g1~~TRINITY_DN4679_c0_g1_i1.p1  ORF type:complete len:312 (-),score=108.67 TRINITY_DN4679_c0_g1_i1:101-985(-)